MKVLITGATGFVGSYLARLLLTKGYQVRATCRKSSRMDLVADIQQDIEWIEGDILDADFMKRATEGVTQVFHCAASVTFDPQQSQQAMTVNVTGTAHVVDACLANNVQQLIHTSSVAAIGRPKNTHIITEDLPWEDEGTATPYARSKYLAEKEIQRGRAAGLAVSTINPTIILGVGYWDSGSCKIFDTLGKGLRFYPIGATGFVDVRDVAQALWRASITPTAIGKRYIINGHNLSYKDLFDKMAIRMGQKPPSIRIGKLLGGLYWRMEKAKSWITNEPPLATQHSVLLASLSYSYDSSASIQDLDMEYRDLNDTLEWACHAWLNAH